MFEFGETVSVCEDYYWMFYTSVYYLEYVVTY